MDIHRTARGRRAARRGSTLAALAILALAACGVDDDALAPTAGDVAGRYEATRAIIMERDLATGITTHDVLQRGGEVVVELRADQTLGGRVFVPGAGGDGSDIDVDLDGTWTLRAGAVRLHPDADTFMTNVAFLVKGRTLDGSYIRATSLTSDIRYEIVLRRQ